MNSTEQTDTLPAGDFFDRHLMAVAEANEKAGRVYFPVAPDPTATTYYTPREKVTMSREDFELPVLTNPDELETALAQLWKDSEELRSLAGPAAELAGALRKAETEDDEVSPFIYVMF